MISLNSAQSRQHFLAMLAEQCGYDWLSQKRAEMTANPTRTLANGLIHVYWRNQSGIEDLHAGQWEAPPLLQRRLTPQQEDALMQNMADGMTPSMHAISNVIPKK